MQENDQKSSDEPEVQEAAAEEPKDEAQPDEIADLRDRLLRLAAEFDNYKKRMAKDLDASKELGRADAIARFLPTLDEFQLALAAVDKEDEHMKGIALIFSNFSTTLKNLGLREIEASGKADPYKHETLLARDSAKPEGTILEVVRKGYMLNTLMLRPASVIVSNGNADGKEEVADKK